MRSSPIARVRGFSPSARSIAIVTASAPILGGWNCDGSERGLEDPRELDVIETHDREVLPDAQTPLARGLVDPRRKQVVIAENCGWSRLQVE